MCSSDLSTVLKSLNANPKLELSGVKALKLTLAQSNDHWGARHFAKEHLPRLKWANQALEVEVTKVPKSAAEVWRPELELRFENGKTQTINLQNMWSTAIVRSIMDTAGAPSWAAWKVRAQEQGLPVLPGEENEGKERPQYQSSEIPSLAQFRASAPPPPPKAAPTPKAKAEKGVDPSALDSKTVSGPDAALP